MAKIVCIVPAQEMVAQANRQARKHGIDHFSVVMTRTAHLRDVADEAIANGADIFVARGLQASILQSFYDTPVVEICFTGQEMGMLVMEAKKLASVPKPKIAVIGIGNMFCDMHFFNDLYKVELTEYLVSEGADLINATDKAYAAGMDIVIGGEVVCSRAEKHGMKTVFLASSDESLSEAMRVVQSVAYASDLERNNTAEMRALLDYSFNGIIKVNRGGTIVYMNHLAENFLNIEGRSAHSLYLSKLIPDIDSSLLDRVFQGEEIYSTVMTINKIPIVANIVPIQTGNYQEVESALVSFCERGRVEEMEEEIRRELYHQRHTAEYTFDNIISDSKELKEIIDQAKTYAKFSAPVLITGEQGTEKEILAQCIHNASILSDGAFVSFNCDSVSPEELDTIIFGTQEKIGDIRKGLLDMAQDGTLFIDKIENLTPYTQYKLYKVIQTRTVSRAGNDRPLPVHVRIIASSQENLVLLVKKGLFREDLFYALNILNLDIPPLRHRKGDILLWINKFMEDLGKRYSRYIRITSSANKMLMDYDWDGNLPQISSFCERVVILSPKRIVNEQFIAQQLKHAYPIVRRNKDDKIIIYKDPKAAQLAELLEECGGNRTLVAEKLGVSKSTLWRYMKKYNMIT